jgi:hypothetical protein
MVSPPAIPPIAYMTPFTTATSKCERASGSGALVIQTPTELRDAVPLNLTGDRLAPATDAITPWTPGDMSATQNVLAMPFASVFEELGLTAPDAATGVHTTFAFGTGLPYLSATRTARESLAVAQAANTCESPPLTITIPVSGRAVALNIIDARAALLWSTTVASTRRLSATDGDGKEIWVRDTPDKAAPALLA